MKRKLVVLAVSSSFAIASHAQSSVTLYGVVDAGITYTSNVQGKSRWAQTSGTVSQSRFGLRGSEDLGNGLKAIFTLESGFNGNNGSLANNGGMFNRQSFVGLSSNYGTVTLGRQYDATQDYLAPLSAAGTWGGTSFAHYRNSDNLSTAQGIAANNSVKFTSANYGGLTFGGTYGFSNNANFTNNREYSVGGAYQLQGLRFAAAYAQQNNPGATTSGATDPGTAPFGLNAARHRTYGLGAAYAFGPVEAGLVWTSSRVDRMAARAGRRLTFNNYEINAKYNLTPALGLGVAYTYTQATGTGAGTSTNAHFNQIGAQADYALSKRTDVYAQVVYQRASKAKASVYEGSDTAVSSGINQSVASVGLRHRF